jgi:phage terminase large subunit
MIPNNRILIGRNAATDLLETTQRDVVDFLWEANLLKTAPNTQTKKAVVHCVDPITNQALGYDSEIFFQHLDDPKHLRGRHLGNYWIDELSECKLDAHLNLQGRLRLPVQAGRYQCLLTGNPEGENWGYDIGWNEELITKLLCKNPKHTHMTFEESNACIRLKRRAIHAKSTDNWFLPESTLDTQMASYTPDQIRRYLGGEFLIMEGAVFGEFDRSVHVLEAA